MGYLSYINWCSTTGCQWFVHENPTVTEPDPRVFGLDPGQRKIIRRETRHGIP